MAIIRVGWVLAPTRFEYLGNEPLFSGSLKGILMENNDVAEIVERVGANTHPTLAFQAA